MKRGTRDKVHNLYTIIAGWIAAAGALLVVAAVFSQWRVGLDHFNLVRQTLTEAIVDDQGREGDLSVTFTICDVGNTNCSVAAHFKDMQGCLSQVKRNGMHCDPISDSAR